MSKHVGTVAGFGLVAVGGVMAVHVAIHPHPNSPAGWLIAGILGAGLLFINPKLVMAAAKQALAFLPWRKSGDQN